jgi:hypothetical protein
MGAIERLVIFALVVYGVWQVGRRMVMGTPEPGPQPARGSAGTTVQDMAQCRACGSYVAAGAGGCGRGDCPRRG